MTLPANSTERARVEFRRRYEYSRDRVFQAWTDPEMLVRWVGPKDMTPLEVTFDPRVGGRYRMVMAPGSVIAGEITEFLAPQRLAYTWVFISAQPDGSETRTVESLVTVTLADVGTETAPATELTLIHEGLSGDSGAAGVSEGWRGSFDKLEDLLRLNTRP